MSDEIMLVSPIISFGSYIIVTFFILGSFIFYGLYASIGSTIGFCIAYYCARKNVWWALEINKNVSFAFFVGFWGGIFGLLWYWIYYATDGSGIFLGVSLLLVFGVIGSTMFVGENILDEYDEYESYDPIEPPYEPIPPILVDEKEEDFFYETDAIEVIDYGNYEIKTLNYEIKGSGSPVKLFNYKNATDPSWEELIDFLEEDSTDRQPYIEDLFDCTDFAEMLHNNAEAVHIKGAWVGIYYVGEEYGHALNAFNTKDKGLVYVDCTGVGFFKDIDIVDENEYCSCDRIAYVLNGSGYGLISLDEAESSEYSFYETHKKHNVIFEKELDEFNWIVERYNSQCEYSDDYCHRCVPPQHQYYPPGTIDETKIGLRPQLCSNVYEGLIEREESLDKLKKEICDCLWDSGSVVSNVEIYW